MQAPNRRSVPDGFYSAREAIEKIGIPQSTFYYLVRTGVIKGVVLPGRKQALYPVTEVNRYARAIGSYIAQFSEDKYSFGLAFDEDLPEMRELYASVFGGYDHAIPDEVLSAWLRKNPESIHVLRRGADIVGYIAMFPLPYETIIKRLSGKLRNRTLPIADIGTFEPSGEPVRLYIAEAIVRQGPGGARLGSILMRDIVKFLSSLVEQGVVVHEVYALGTTPFGNRACRSLGMEPLDLPSTGEGRIPYRLDVLKADRNKLIEKYEQAIERHAV